MPTDEILGARTDNSKVRYTAIAAKLQLPNTYRVGKNDTSYFNFYFGFNRLQTRAGKLVLEQFESGISYTDSPRVNKQGWGYFYNNGLAKQKDPKLHPPPRTPYQIYEWWQPIAAFLGGAQTIDMVLALNPVGLVTLSIAGKVMPGYDPSRGQSKEQLVGLPKLFIGVGSMGNEKNQPSVQFSPVRFIDVQVRPEGQADFIAFPQVDSPVRLRMTREFKEITTFPPAASYNV
jgi:hypothetical protein